MPDRDIPKKVDEYVKQIKEDNPSYDDAQAWATAWSIYCKYKNPGSDHCQQPAADYFPGKSASAKELPIKVKHPERLDAAAHRVIRDYENGDISYKDLHHYLERKGYQPEPLYKSSPKAGSPLMLRRDYGSVKQASTGQNCEFYKARDGKWYMGLSDYPPDDEEREYWHGDIEDWYGPFASFEDAYQFLHRNFANPGGYNKDSSGRRPPPKKPHSPSRRWASATERVVARFKAQRHHG